MSDRAEREKQLDWLYRLKSNLKIFIPKDFHLAEFEQSLDYAISSIKTDLKYDLLYEETKHIANVSKMIEPTTKNDCAEQNGCITCLLDDGDDCCRKLYEESMQEPTPKNDLAVELISREDVLQILLDYDYANENALVLKDIKALPSVTPQELRWIPVNKKLPEDYETVIASVDRGYVYPEARYSKEKGWEWAYESGAEIWIEIKCDVIAWMPLPKAYEPQESENKKEETEYQRQVEQYQYDTLYEPTFDLETGSM